MHSDPLTPAPRMRISPTLGLFLVLLITVAVYWPGLSGGYLFDDFPNIVDNTDLQIDSLSASNLARSALSSPSSEFKRPLASLSFSANFLATGLNPFWMKLTNLFIHLLNGVLFYALALALIRVSRSNTTSIGQHDPRWIALLISACWLLLPINLTSVLYVVQRMESLANLFVLLGLLGYIYSRERMQKDGRGFFMAISSVAAGSAAGLMSKETAVMTPLYAALIEWALFGARSMNRPRDYRIIGLFALVLLLPLILGLVWQFPRLLNSAAWAKRNFDLPQRLMTETRVVVDYIQWTLLPTPQALSFYHDDYVVSKGWLQPWTTLLCTLILAALTTLAIGIRKRAPLVALGLTLFLGAQLLTATILPLELVYEHRNYFASFGLLLAVVPLLAAGVQQLPAANARHLLLGGLMCLWAAVTVSAALAWGEPITLARTLAERAPNSPRAQYGLGYAYILQSQYAPQSPFSAAAYAPLEKAMHLPGSSILAEHALIIMNTCCMKQPVKDEWWDSLISKLKAKKPAVQDEGALESMVNCTKKTECAIDKRKMVEAFLAGLSHPKPTARLLGVYAIYAWNVLEDRELALTLAADATLAAPAQSAYRINYTRMLIHAGKLAEADRQFAALKSLNYGGRLNIELESLNKLRTNSQRHAQ